MPVGYRANCQPFAAQWTTSILPLRSRELTALSLVSHSCPSPSWCLTTPFLLSLLLIRPWAHQQAGAKKKSGFEHVGIRHFHQWRDRPIPPTLEKVKAHIMRVGSRSEQSQKMWAMSNRLCHVVDSLRCVGLIQVHRSRGAPDISQHLTALNGRLSRHFPDIVLDGMVLCIQLFFGRHELWKIAFLLPQHACMWKSCCRMNEPLFRASHVGHS